MHRSEASSSADRLVQDYFSTPELERNWPIYNFWRPLIVKFQWNLQDCAVWDRLSDQSLNLIGIILQRQKINRNNMKKS